MFKREAPLHGQEGPGDWRDLARQGGDFLLGNEVESIDAAGRRRPGTSACPASQFSEPCESNCRETSLTGQCFATQVWLDYG